MAQAATAAGQATRSAADGERLPRKSVYDFVVVGGGPNGLGAAAYLSKWGFSVCMLEARPEVGGGVENYEPVPGYSCDAHASFFYGGAAPAMDQLELGRYGFRLSLNSAGVSITPGGKFVSHGAVSRSSAAGPGPRGLHRVARRGTR